MEIKKGFNYPEIDRTQSTRVSLTGEELRQIGELHHDDARCLLIRVGIDLARISADVDDDEILLAVACLGHVRDGDGEFVQPQFEVREGFRAARAYDEASSVIARLQRDYGDDINPKETN